ncbi:MAG: YncE family protein, partial [Steroidobacteraceae bacterium]
MIRASRLAFAGALTVGAATLAISFPAAAKTLPFTVAHRIALDGGSPIAALAFAPDGKFAYAGAGDELHSFDVATGAPDATVKVQGPVVDLATSPDAGGRLYAAVGRPARLLVLSLHPLRVRSSVEVRGTAPSALLDEPGEHALYIESRTGHSVARLDSGTGRTIAVARLSGEPTQMAGDGRGTLYVA